MESRELISAGFGQRWGHTLSYTNSLQNPGGETNGNNWFVKEIPRVYFGANGAIAAIHKINQPFWFDQTGTGTYDPTFALKAAFEAQAILNQYSKRDFEGNKTLFIGFGEAIGKFKGVIDPGGHQTLAEYDSTGWLTQFERRASGQTAGYSYEPCTSGASAGQLSRVTYALNGTAIRRSSFAYYEETDAGGSEHDLKGSMVEQHVAGASAWLPLTQSYYRYYKNGDANGSRSGMKYMVKPEAYARMVRAGLTPESATDAHLAQYADYYFEYDGAQRVSKEVVAAGARTYAFSYSGSGFADDFNSWKTKTVEALPDGNQRVVYANYAGLPMLKVLIAGSSEWYQYWKFDDRGRTILQAESSAVAGYDETVPGLVTLKSSAGLLRVFEYFSNPLNPGHAPGYLKSEGVSRAAPARSPCCDPINT